MDRTKHYKGRNIVLRGGAAVFLAAALVAVGPTLAQAAGKSEFDAGVQAARQGDYRQALDYFMQAMKNGMDTAALQYNLAVSFYKTGRMEAAKKAFLNAAQKPAMAGPAYYQLGRIAREQGQEDQARVWFQKAYRHARTGKMRRLAQLALDGTGERRAARRWLLWTEFGAGHDDNALLVPPELAGASGEDDSFYDLTLYGYYDFRGPRKQEGLRLHGLVSTQRYSDLDAFDYAATEAGVSYPLGGPEWTTRLGIATRSSEFGGNDYQDSTEASIRVQGPLGRHWRLKTALTYESIDPAAVYAFLDGKQTELEFKFRRRGELELLYGFQTNDREDLLIESSGEFRSFSPTRHRFGFEYEPALNRQWTLLLGAGFRQSRYDEPDRRGDGTTLKREDNRWRTRFGLTWTSARRWRLETAVHYLENDSNFNEFDYDKTVVSLSLSKAFPGL